MPPTCVVASSKSGMVTIPMIAHTQFAPSRRDFFMRSAHGFGTLAFASLLASEGRASSPDTGNPFSPKVPHHTPKVKNVIFLFMEGGPSHLDTFDPKPELRKMAGKPLPPSFGPVVTPMGVGGNKLLADKRKWKQHGESGIWVSDWLPHIAEVVDDICLTRACWADGLNHVGSVLQMNTGSILAGRPSLGSWAVYGLGTENRNLPGYVVLTDGGNVTGGARNWGTGFMPATYQGTLFRTSGSPILNLSNPKGIEPSRQIGKLDLIRELNDVHRAGREDDSNLSARQDAYELAFRMQAAAPDAVDLSGESERTKRMYGLDRKECASFARPCLTARRLIERGVRFVQVYCGAGSKWDAHSNIEGNHSGMCARADQPTAALIRDLKERGLLDETLVIWGGEFGRTPMTEGSSGRDHNPYGFSMFFAGGGVKPGTVVGETDEFGLYGVSGRAHVHDLHATILHLLGFDHEKLTFSHGGREERLTVVSGRVLDDMLV